MSRLVRIGCVAIAIVAAGVAVFAQDAKQPQGKQVDHVTVTHLGQQPEEQHPWGAIHWLMNNKIDPGAQQTFGVVRINPGEKNALHLHPNCEELMYILSGSGSTTVGGKVVSLRAGDLVRIPAGVLHQATATGREPLIAVISYSSADRQVINYESQHE
jgi:mannose-6-phosphate isomerase-like protein (cupin superfamily)